MTHRVVRYGVIVAAAVAALWWIPRYMGTQGRAAPAGDKTAVATPHTADGHPDLSGLWNASAPRQVQQVDEAGYVITSNNIVRGATPVNAERDAALRRRMDPNRPIYKPEFWQKVQDLDYNGNTEDPTFGCMAAGVPRMGPPSKIVQTPGEMIFLYEAKNQFRVIPMDGRAHDPDKSQDLTLMGDSVGHWEGDTLVVDVIGLSDVSWLDIHGYFHSDKLHVIERLRREGNTLTYQATAEDPVVLLKPWVRNPVKLQLSTDPKVVLWEDAPCSDIDLPHIVDKEHH
jgi:hypothetical protein